jgi:hypothetical protein
MNAFKKLILPMVAVVMFFSSCKDDDPVAPTLYDELGGTAMVADPNNAGSQIEKGRLGIRSVVDSTIFIIAGDSRLTKFFPVLLSEVGAGNLSGFSALSKNLTDFISIGAGAKSYTYSGDSMKDAHDPAKNPRMAEKAANADMDAFIDDVVKGAKKVGVPDAQITKVGVVLESLRADIVQK